MHNQNLKLPCLYARFDKTDVLSKRRVNCLIAFVNLSLRCELDVDLILSVPEFTLFTLLDMFTDMSKC